MSETVSARRLRLPAQPSSVAEFQSLAREAGMAFGFSPEALFRLELALEEVLVNVVNHAYRQQAEGWIELSCRAGETDELVFEVRDGGRPFDPLSLPEPEIGAQMSDRGVGGLGVFLLRKMADRVSYRRGDDQNILTLTFRRSAEAADHLPD
jgi:serine/threonine-protein kinase RsbW